VVELVFFGLRFSFCLHRRIYFLFFSVRLFLYLKTYFLPVFFFFCFLFFCVSAGFVGGDVVGTDGEIADDSHFLLTARLSVFILTTHSMLMIDTWELFCYEIWCISAPCSLSLSLSLSLGSCLFVCLFFWILVQGSTLQELLISRESCCRIKSHGRHLKPETPKNAMPQAQKFCTWCMECAVWQGF
jgi:hypothetical protein